MNGILLINKPAHMTSFGVVARVRRRLSEEAGHKIKVGHTGTLDPFATGLMIIVVGTACREAGRFSKLDKTYEAIIRLGVKSTTGDPEGELTHISDVVPDRKSVETAVNAFTGTIVQTPPMFSAIKINGRRAYELARKGEVIDIPKREVTIHSLKITKYHYPELQISTHVSSGTYIRTLAQDIGENLGTGAYTTELRRTSVGSFVIEDALAIDDVSFASISELPE